jgi:GAF domain-containing protein
MKGQLTDRTAHEGIHESSQLRRCVRDLVALSALPALWVGRDSSHIVESLADALLSIFRPELVYVGLRGSPDEIVIEAARAPGQPGADKRAQQIGAALAGWLKPDGAGLAAACLLALAIPNPAGDGTVRLAVMPIGYEGEWGTIAVGASPPDFPSELDRLALNVAANQAAMALQNARNEAALRASEARYRDLSDELEQRVRERTAELTRSIQALDAEVAERKQAERTSQAQTRALTQILEQLTQEPRFEAFPGILLAAIVEEFGAASGSLWRYDPAGDCLERLLEFVGGRRSRGDAADLPALPSRIDAGWVPDWEELKAACLRGECRVYPDVGHRPDMVPHHRAALRERGIRTIVVVPMLLQGRLAGVLTLRSTREEPYGPHDFSLALALAHQATLGLEMARLAEQAGRMAVLEERNRIAGEIHDGLGQTFTGIIVQLEAADRGVAGEPERAQAHLRIARELAREGLAEARRSARALRPQRAGRNGSGPRAGPDGGTVERRPGDPHRVPAARHPAPAAP